MAKFRPWRWEVKPPQKRRMKRQKYGNSKTTIDGIRFDSKREAQRWQELRLMERAGRITDLRRQVKFVLVPSQRGEDGKVIEKQVAYIADFVYLKDGKTVVEDSKGYRTEVYMLKKKMMLYFFHIRIQEV